jgi:hypothetical protein
MDALNFEYPDYEKLDKGAEGVKRKKGCQHPEQASFPTDKRR